jgi:RNase P/RNase MRP subunit POP5
VFKSEMSTAMIKVMKRRYIAFRLTVKVNPSKYWIRDILARVLPEDGEQRSLHLSNLRVIDYDWQTGLGVVRCDQKSREAIQDGIFQIPNISQDVLKAEVLGVSGTLRALRRKFLNPKQEHVRHGNS